VPAYPKSIVFTYSGGGYPIANRRRSSAGGTSPRLAALAQAMGLDTGESIGAAVVPVILGS